MCADDDGAVIIPADRVDEVLAVAQRIEQTEEAITAAVLAGATLRQARSRHGYHALQTPSGPSTTKEPR